ncbi:MAG: tRNA lysidine(34) synthetase TilS [Candidatus Izimaplasma sp.]|nr:tRNA lysidine(34) synthetase TilS [Candidatus Izimaplasma bacterium]
MKKDLREFVLQKRFFKKDETIVVALSGGVDSMVLLDILNTLKLNLNIIISHVNHKKREESDKEFNSIKDLAKSLKIPFEGYIVKEREKVNFHDDSRNQRYSFFKAVAQKYKASKIIVAHHLDDQVETTLMRLTRGTSFSGYAGIPEIRKDRNISIIRPLMEITKDEILTYAKENSVTYYEDSSNKEDVYTRNRYRHNIIPLLKEENPNLNEKIIQFKDYIESADIVLNKIKEEYLKKNCFYNNVNLKTFNNLDKIIKIKVLQYLVNVATDNKVEVSYQQYNSMIELCLSDNPNKTISLAQNYNFVKEYDYIYIVKKEKIVKQNFEINDFGEYFVSDNDSFVFSDNKIKQYNTNYFELCYNGKVFPLFLRNRNNGDKMNLKIGTKKVKDILIDQKIPLSKRDKIFMLADSESILWIPGIKKSHQSKKFNKKIYIYEVK